MKTIKTNISLNGWCAIILDKDHNVNYSTTKDLDFFWHNNYLHDMVLRDCVNKGKYQMISRNTIYEEDVFIWFDLYPEQNQI